MMDSRTGYIFYRKNLANEYEFANNTYLKLFGLNDIYELHKLSDIDLLNLSMNTSVWSIDEYSNSFTKESELTLDGNGLYILDAHIYDKSNLTIFLTSKSPSFSDSGKINGFVTNSRIMNIQSIMELEYLVRNKIVDVTKYSLSNLLSHYFQVDYNPNSNSNNLRNKMLEKMGRYKINLSMNLVKPLSKREKQCLQLFLKGKTNRGVAQELGLSFRTIEMYSESIKAKLNVLNKAEMLAKGFELVMLDPSFLDF